MSLVSRIVSLFYWKFCYGSKIYCFPNLAAQKIDVRCSVVVMEFYSCSKRNFVTFDLDRSSKKSSLDIESGLESFRES